MNTNRKVLTNSVSSAYGNNLAPIKSKHCIFRHKSGQYYQFDDMILVSIDAANFIPVTE